MDAQQTKISPTDSVQPDARCAEKNQPQPSGPAYSPDVLKTSMIEKDTVWRATNREMVLFGLLIICLAFSQAVIVHLQFEQKTKIDILLLELEMSRQFTSTPSPSVMPVQPPPVAVPAPPSEQTPAPLLTPPNAASPKLPPGAMHI